MERTAKCAPSGEIKESWPEYGPGSRICYLQANEIVKTTARDYRERHMVQRFRQWPESGTSGRVHRRIEVKALRVCSLARTDENCKLVIDRSNPVSPSTVQMYSSQIVTIVVKNPTDYWPFAQVSPISRFAGL